MLVYRSAERTADPRELLDGIESAWGDSARELSREKWVELLIDAGELEAALVDLQCPEHDATSPMTRAARHLTQQAARGLVAAWHSGKDSAPAGVARTDGLHALHSLELPCTVCLKVPEGFAYYGLYPETYLEAARQFRTEFAPERVTVIGIRSIGTSLSAVVAATLAHDGVGVRSFTVRPRGHPFDRHLSFAPELARTLSECSSEWFAVVDEGPGLSGSSFASVAAALSELGVPNERIVLFPSWLPEAGQLMSPRARDCWPRHRKFVGNFDSLWVASGRLAASRDADLTDWSGGQWRAHAYAREQEYPAVNPQHEQRKFLVADTEHHNTSLLKFVGLGRHGAERHSRAERLVNAGFIAPARGLRDGFLSSEFVEGVQLTARDATPAFLRHVASYVAHLHRHERGPADVSTDQLVEMIRCNVSEAMGEDALGALAGLESQRPPAPSVTVRGDARMMPHEWLRTSKGWLKTDALTHSDDHFLPGAQDSAWDLAATEVEFALDPERMQLLLGEYSARSGDAGIRARMPFYRVAYVSCRLGYVTMSDRAMGNTPDAERMRGESLRYSTLLREELLSGLQSADHELIA